MSVPSMVKAGNRMSSSPAYERFQPPYALPVPPAHRCPERKHDLFAWRPRPLECPKTLEEAHVAAQRGTRHQAEQRHCAQKGDGPDPKVPRPHLVATLKELALDAPRDWG